MLNKFLIYFNARSLKHLLIIFLVFSISGSLTIFLSEPLIFLLNIDYLLNTKILYYTTRILIIFPLYQIILLFVGFIFGEYEYFVEFEKKTFKKLFSIKK
ncbi:MAG: hypothetical protein CMN50_07870 [SAR116 cluster bacterium]|jgi:hypothetical protein|nr:hypothetical protein [SAR116 cluster bacterium]|tara:strand:+ start:105 stop:404 length:300 start_codon:yes stop_codon:yes gene_type:complete